MDKSCIKCGRCLAVCPVYKASGYERVSPRGKLNLIDFYQKHLLSPSSIFQETISACILCKRCEEKCILHTPVSKIIHQTREKLWPLQKKQYYRSWMVNKFLASHQKNLGLWLRLYTLCKHVFPSPFDLASSPFLSSRGFYPSKKAKANIAIFSGCVTNFIYPSLGNKLAKLLSELGYNVFIPHQQTCCGLMAYTLGDKETALDLAKKNVEALSSLSIDFIITPCASCYHQLKTFLPYQEAKISEKVIELSQFLQEKPLSFLPLNKKITWHDPCHLRYHHNIWQEPRILLKKAGYEFEESSPEGMCCGQGGSFALNFPELAKQILKKRKEAIKKTGAELVITSCMGCLIQLKAELGKKRVKHVLEPFA